MKLPGLDIGSWHLMCQWKNIVHDKASPRPLVAVTGKGETGFSLMGERRYRPRKTGE